MENWVLLGKFNSEAEARVIQSLLASLDIECQLYGSHSRPAGLVPDMLRLMVRSEDLEKAREAMSANPPPGDEE